MLTTETRSVLFIPTKKTNTVVKATDKKTTQIKFKTSPLTKKRAITGTIADKDATKKIGRQTFIKKRRREKSVKSFTIKSRTTKAANVMQIPATSTLYAGSPIFKHT